MNSYSFFLPDFFYKENENATWKLMDAVKVVLRGSNSWKLKEKKDLKSFTYICCSLSFWDSLKKASWHIGWGSHMASVLPQKIEWGRALPLWRYHTLAFTWLEVSNNACPARWDAFFMTFKTQVSPCLCEVISIMWFRWSFQTVVIYVTLAQLLSVLKMQIVNT